MDDVKTPDTAIASGFVRGNTTNRATLPPARGAMHGGASGSLMSYEPMIVAVMLREMTVTFASAPAPQGL